VGMKTYNLSVVSISQDVVNFELILIQNSYNSQGTGDQNRLPQHEVQIS